MASSYSKGELVVCTGTFKNTAGTPTDPTTPLFAYCDGGGWHRGLTPTRTGTGVYTYSVDTSTPDTSTPDTLPQQETWWYQFYSPPGDALQASDQTSFFVVNRGRF